ncbi:MAG: hypothetical protein L3J68_03770 [Thermoplasmata archaeon]|nr:hypothetical protein [Thermoplasmata archaeon]
MSIRGSQRAAAAFLIAALLVSGGAAAFYASAPARAASEAVHLDASATVQVTAQAGFSFTPNTFAQVSPNTTVTVTFTDSDAVDHTFTIIGKQGWVIPADASSDEINELAFGRSPAPLFTANATSVGNPGDQVTGNFSAPAAGWYEFICAEPGHFQNGMYGFIAFGENLPPNLTVVAADTDPGIAVFIIVGTIVSLVVIALVLGFVVGRRRGSTYEMPPQRLGYPEPGSPATAENPPLPHEPRG